MEFENSCQFNPIIKQKKNLLKIQRNSKIRTILPKLKKRTKLSILSIIFDKTWKEQIPSLEGKKKDREGGRGGVNLIENITQPMLVRLTSSRMAMDYASKRPPRVESRSFYAFPGCRSAEACRPTTTNR